jgi:hypothetical protein
MERAGSNGKASDFYTKRPWFESRPGYWLQLKIFLSLLGFYFIRIIVLECIEWIPLRDTNFSR